MDAESARAHIEECERLKSGSCFTILTDGWEDIMRRSLYGTVAAKVGELPTVLSLEDMTGRRGSAVNILKSVTDGMSRMELPAQNCIAITTDNPTVMASVRSKFAADNYWILVSCAKSLNCTSKIDTKSLRHLHAFYTD